MAQYIDKDALVAEIERRKQTWQHQDQQYVAGGRDVCDYLLGFLNTLEVKEVDLDEYYHKFLEKEWFGKNCCRTISEMMAFTAKHFFELGTRVNNPITSTDRGTAEKIIINLKRVENDYHIDLTKQMEWLRNIVKKGK